MNYTARQGEIPLTNNETIIKINEAASKGYRFEMEVLGAFKGSTLYQQDKDIRMIAGTKGYCDGIIYHAPKRDNHEFDLNRIIMEIEVKLRNGIGREDRATLIDVMKGTSVQQFLKGSTKAFPNAYNRVLVLGLVKDFGSQNANGLSSYDLYGSIGVVFFRKIRLAASEYRYDQVIRFYDSFSAFNSDLYLATSSEDYFDRLNGSSSTKKYFEMISLGKLKELSFVILDSLNDFTAVEEQIFRKILGHQIKIGVDNTFKSMNSLVGNNNATTYMKRLFENEWILRHQKTYRVNFPRIIEDLFQTSSSINVNAIMREAGLNV